MVWRVKRMAYLVLLAAWTTAMARAAGQDNHPLTLRLRTLQETPPGSAQWRSALQRVEWDPAGTAAVICDMWDKHWCQGATARVAEMAPRLNEVVTELRRRGVLIIHCPSETMAFYAGTPARQRAQSAPRTPPAPPSGWGGLDATREAPLPIDDSDGGCNEETRCPTGQWPPFPWSRQIAAIEIKDEDAVTDSVEAWYLMRQRGISNVLVMGVRENMCVLGRPFGIRQLVKLGQNVALLRDLTDTMYNSRRKPYVDHFTGTDLVTWHIEKYWCPTLTSDQIVGGQPFAFAADQKPSRVYAEYARLFPAAPLRRPAVPAPAAPPISLASLLEEMVDREVLARWPAPAYTCKQESSWDRRSVAPDKPGWFANVDTGQYLRVETNGTRLESVMLDAAGPGCVVRWWAGGTTPEMGPPGTIRIYLDGSPKPILEAKMDTLVSSSWLAGPPLAAQRCIGRNFYLPIPYAQRCKITYDRPPLKAMGDESNRHWYVIEYRTYPGGTAVRSFTLDDLKKSRRLLDRVGETLMTPANQAWESAGCLPARRARLEPGQAVAQTLAGPRALRRLSVQLRAADLPQALRSTVLIVHCDGERTIWCPVGDFFGSGVGLNPYRDWWREVDRNGLLTCYWVMPFRESCRLELLNLGAQPVEATLGAIAHTAWTWDDRSLHFHAGWRQQAGLQTRQADGTMDWNYLEVTGEGLYVGDSLALHNGAAAWWGEGDEKIYVDGEAFPSHFGTGSEDYYGYSFGDLGTFWEAPFHAEPRWEGNRKPGWVSVTRTRSLEAIPFTRSLRFDLEIWHWAATRMTYAAATYWYARPGARGNRQPQPEEAARPLHELEGRLRGVLEGEALRLRSKTGGLTEVQHEGRWSGGQQLWWRDARPGDRLELLLPVATAGRYQLVMHGTRAFDYGICQFWLDGEKLGEPLDLYSKENIDQSATLTTRTFQAGDHVLTAEMVGSNPAGKARHMLGLDYLRLVPVGPP
jgi:nicotinamidase-related amidase